MTQFSDLFAQQLGQRNPRLVVKSVAEEAKRTLAEDDHEQMARQARAARLTADALASFRSHTAQTPVDVQSEPEPIDAETAALLDAAVDDLDEDANDGETVTDDDPTDADLEAALIEAETAERERLEREAACTQTSKPQSENSSSPSSTTSTDETRRPTSMPSKAHLPLKRNGKGRRNGRG